MVSMRPHRQYTVLQWGHVDLQEDANDSFVSNNNMIYHPIFQHLLSQTNKYDINCSF